MNSKRTPVQIDQVGVAQGRCRGDGHPTTAPKLQASIALSTYRRAISPARCLKAARLRSPLKSSPFIQTEGVLLTLIRSPRLLPSPIRGKESGSAWMHCSNSARSGTPDSFAKDSQGLDPIASIPEKRL